MRVTQRMKDDLEADGAFVARQMFDSDQLSRLRAAFDHGVAHPSPVAQRMFEGTDDEHFNDLFNYAHLKRYLGLIDEMGLANFAADLWDSEHVWFLGEELFIKSGGKVGRSPWHQDTSYTPADGPHMLNLWISFEPLPRRNALEIVRGSHRGITYDGSAYADPADPTRPVWGDGTFPRLPDIEAERKRDADAWEILGWDLEPGDVLVFHSGALHGGAPVDSECAARHTLVFRFHGDAYFYRPLPETKPDYPIDLSKIDDRTRVPGEPYRSPYQPQLR